MRDLQPIKNEKCRFTSLHSGTCGRNAVIFSHQKEFNKPAFAKARKSTHPQKTPLSKDSNQT